MGGRVGILAGSGRFVSWALAEMKKKGVSCIIAGIEGEADPSLAALAEFFTWVRAGEMGRVLAYFHSHQLLEVMMIGKIRAGAIFQRENFDTEAKHLWERAQDKSPAAVLAAFIDYLEARGLRVLSPGSLLGPYFCAEGLLTARPPSAAFFEDVDFGLRQAKPIADLEIGQTLIVKDGSVVAVEGMEGTDGTIERGGRLAGSGFVAVKVGRTHQDMRVDVPAVGLDTVLALVRAGGAGLGLEAEKVAFFQREEAVALADAHNVSIVVRKI